MAGAASNLTDTYMFVMLDLDVPPQQGSTTRRVLLHALETGYKATQQKAGAATVLAAASRTKGPAPYLPPGPPATDTMAHRYVQLLFKEPTKLNVQASDFANTTGRFDFNIQKFMTENSLAAPLAANFFTVDGRANGTAGGGNGGNGGRGGSATSSGSGPRRTTQPFEGSAGRRGVSYGLIGLLSGLVVLVL
ncbi:phosphatidylethanolamine-binding protein [Phaeosphaeriaceae sp. PMI808]|nr:phosphatidylethanolamine-binding protein [Phaeosphaeriaceae sp. PMI808]